MRLIEDSELGFLLRLIDPGNPVLSLLQRNPAIMIRVIKPNDLSPRVTAGLFRRFELASRQLAIGVLVPAIEFLQQSDHLPLDRRLGSDRPGTSGTRGK